MPGFEFIRDFFEKTKELNKFNQYQQVVQQKNDELKSMMETLKKALAHKNNDEINEVKNTIRTFNPYAPHLYKELASLYLEAGFTQEADNLTSIADSLH